jgi:hypothetical protein
MQHPVEAHLPALAGESVSQRDLRVRTRPAGPQPVEVATFQTQYSQNMAEILAYTALPMMPALGFSVLAERHFIGAEPSAAPSKAERRARAI